MSIFQDIPRIYKITPTIKRWGYDHRSIEDIPGWEVSPRGYIDDTKSWYKCYDYLPDLNFYRFCDDEFTLVSVHIYRAIRETPKGYWIVKSDHTQTWVSKESNRRFCYPTKAEAWDSYVARKNSHYRHLSRKMADLEDRLKLIERFKNDSMPK